MATVKLRKSTKIGRRTALYALVEFKTRLRGVLHIIGGSGATRETITKRLNANGCRTSRSSVTRWMDPDNRAVPDSYQLLVISALSADISLDWLMGKKRADSAAEQYIESQLKHR
jgi:hypothetical protein